MQLTGRQVAEAFSGQDFETAFPYLGPDIEWDLVGSDPLVGQAAVIAACQQTAEHLDGGVTVEVEKFTVVDGGDRIAVDTVTTYASPDGRYRIASCDLYELVDGMVVAITSYTVELPA